MKEYKVVKANLGFGSWNEKIEGLLNKHAREGWIFKQFDSNFSLVILERDKNR